MMKAISFCSAEAVRSKAAHAGGQARVDFALYGTVDPEEGSKRILEQVEAGVAAFKFSTFGTDPKRFPRIFAPLMAECFAAIAPTGLTAGVHNENDEYVRWAMEQVKASGITDYRAHEMSRPPLTELLAMNEIYEIGAATGCPAHVVHCSLGRGLRDRRRLSGAGSPRHGRMPDPLPDDRQRDRCQAPRRQVEMQSADPPARRGGKSSGGMSLRAT